MSNFGRVIRLALQHKTTVVASLVCSLVVAVFWAGNITAVLPVVDGVMHGKSIPDMLAEELAGSESRIAEIETQLAGPESAASRLQLELAKETALIESLRPLKSFAEEWLPDTAFGTLLFVCLAVFLGTVLKNVFRVVGLFLTARLGKMVDFELRKEFYRRTLRLDLATICQTKPGDLMNRFTTEVGWAAYGVQLLFSTAIREPLKNVRLPGWGCLCELAVATANADFGTAGGLRRALAGQSAEAGQPPGLGRILHGVRPVGGEFWRDQIIKAFTMESHERGRFHQISKQYYQRSMRIALYDSLASPVVEVIGIGMIMAAILAGGYLVLNQQTHLLWFRISDEPLTHGWLTLFYAMLAGASDPVRRLAGVVNNLQRASAASDRVYELFDRSTDLQEPAVPMVLPEKVGRISFNDVRFSYQENEPVLDGVSLQMAAGETVAILGPNGCGKSTLMNLVARFYDPISGSVTLEGIDLRNVRLRDLRSRIGMVTQETLLFNDTVENNILYGSPGASRSAVIAAAKKAHAHQFITEKLSEGYDTLCGSKGSRLSGGQRQRIVLARAILRDPDILILDEATSQIDVKSERLIHDVLEQFVKGRTVFMITHRPSTLSWPIGLW